MPAYDDAYILGVVPKHSIVPPSTLPRQTAHHNFNLEAVAKEGSTLEENKSGSNGILATSLVAIYVCLHRGIQFPSGKQL